MRTKCESAADARFAQEMSRLSRRDGVLRKVLRFTYELHIDNGTDAPEFEALTCFEQDLMSEVRRILVARGAKSIEVKWMGRPLLTLGGAASS